METPQYVVAQKRNMYAYNYNNYLRLSICEASISLKNIVNNETNDNRAIQLITTTKLTSTVSDQSELDFWNRNGSVVGPNDVFSTQLDAAGVAC